jgi:aspartate kinase
VILKFGGTSVASEEGRDALVRRVAETVAEGSSVVVVVSAMGRAGSPYATDTLLELVGETHAGDRELDRLASCGEIIASVVVARALREAGIGARSFSGAEAGIVTDGRHGDADVVAIAPFAIRAALDEGVVPVVAGFQGVAASGQLTTLGRGGSDTTACALGVALSADAVEICTDVEGVMTADPRVCQDARVIDVMEFEELFQMARHGARVVHAPAAELAMSSHVPLVIRGTFSALPGTLVTDAHGVVAAGVRRLATAVTHVDGVARVSVELPQTRGDSAGMAAQTRIYRVMADADVSLDMFTPCSGRLVFSVRAGDLPRALERLDDVALPYEVTTDLAKVTLVGAGMHGVPGVMARVSEALAGDGVAIHQVADSHTTISVLVWQNSRRTAVAALHQAFGLETDGQGGPASDTADKGE